MRTRASLITPVSSIAQRLRASAAKAQRILLGDARSLSRVGLGALLVLALCFGMDSGVTYDEPLHREYGERILAWYSSGFRDQSVFAFVEMHLYGGLFDMSVQGLLRILPLETYAARHLILALLAVLGVVGTARVAIRIGGRWAGFWAGFLLALTPAWVGHGLFNPKDIPFAVAAVFATEAALRLAQGPAPSRWRDVVRAAAMVGLALAVRAAGWFLFAFPLLACTASAGVEAWRRKRTGQQLELARSSAALLARAMVLLTVAWLVMLSGWPWALQSPITRPLEAMHAFAHFPPQGDTLFRSALVASDALPWSYLPTWFAISLPELYLVPAFCALVWLRLRFKKQPLDIERALGAGLVVASALVPLAAVMLLRPVQYDAQRHFLFVYPPLAALSGAALATVLHAPQLASRFRLGVAAAVLVLGAWVARDMAQLHPYEYVYFNASSGGLREAVARYETDYWGASYKEGLAWTVAHAAELGTSEPLRVAACDDNANERLSYYVERWPGAAARVRITPDAAHAEVLLAMPRELSRLTPGRVVHEVERQSAPLLYVIRAYAPALPARAAVRRADVPNQQ